MEEDFWERVAQLDAASKSAIRTIVIIEPRNFADRGLCFTYASKCSQKLCDSAAQECTMLKVQ